jgi:3-oxoacyl-[acyl-carrier protein] reductase
MTDNQLLADKVAIVTGGAAGIGEAVCRLFGQLGARVLLLDKDREPAEKVAAEIRAAGASCASAVADVRDPAALAKAVSLTVETYGRVDCLINNAGAYPRRRFVEMTEAEWDDMQNVNLKSMFHMTKLVAPLMIERKQGWIVNISSITFFIGLQPLAHYVAAKGGVIGFTRSLARELGGEGIHVNCITPGAIKTESEKNFVSEEAANEVIPLQSLRRRILPVDIARVCAFLCSPLSDAMTGQTLNVDGGWVMY